MLNTTKILVTGGAGFIGSHLVDKLLADGHTVVALDNLENGKEENLENAKTYSTFTFLKGDILNSNEVDNALEGVSVVYHLACMGVRHSLHSPVYNHKVNAEGTLTLLEGSRKHKISKFFYISTSEIYGDIETFPITEAGIPKPKTVYGASKLVGEHYAYSYYICFGLDTTVLRIFNNYGPRAHYEGDAGEIIPRSIVRMFYGEKPVVFGDGLVTRDFYFVKDTARALASLLNKTDITGQTFNIGTGVEITMKNLLEKLIKLTGKDNELTIEYMPDRPADVPRLWVDASKFNAMSGMDNLKNFDEGLLETIEYYKTLIEKRNILDEIKLQNWQ
ncbi:MAG: SDR family NAD(P)-dependent oxidoreductase [Sphingobacteriales bacterium JAD_PAG50586_3]|nr:MAG: SDR family NAD(P)-dependent oxidoreductase [Sphingobacteriales bacterium JAD_PAG50586_3]